MPKVNYSVAKKPQTKKINVKEITCVMCGKTQKPTMHYQSYNPIHATGYLPYCKQCLRDMCYDTNGNININNVKDMLKLIDRPFIYSVFKNACEDKNDTVGTYMKNIALNNKRSGWENSIFEPSCENNDKNNFTHDFKITPEMIVRWGNHNQEDYQNLEQFYWDMKARNKIETPQEEVYLKKLATISVKMDNELAAGHYDEVKKLGDLFSKYMADSQFRAIDKTEADKTGGIRTFGQAYAEAEKDDFIPPWEYYRKIKGISQDIVDKTIMHIENHTLRMNKINIMVQPPSDTPKLEEGEY